MKPFLIFNEIQETLLKVIFAQNIDRAIEIFADGNEVNGDLEGEYGQYFNIGNDYYSITSDVDFVIDSKYDIDKVEKLLDDLESGQHWAYENSHEDGIVITKDNLINVINSCKTNFVSMVDKISFLKEKNLFINGLTDDQINFYYEKFAKVK